MMYRGFASIAIILIILGVLAASGAWYYQAHKVFNVAVPPPSTETETASPSATSVSAPAATTSVTSTGATSTSTASRANTSTAKATAGPNWTPAPPPAVRTANVAGWKTYVNTDLGFSIQYPSDMYVTPTVEPGSPEQISLYFTTTPNAPSLDHGLSGISFGPNDPDVIGVFGFPAMTGGTSNPPAKSEVLRQIAVDGITANVHTVDASAFTRNVTSSFHIYREIDVSRPHEFISFESMVPGSDLTSAASQSFMIDKIVATLRFFPFPTLGPVGSETLKMDPNEGEYYDLNDNNVYYETGKITLTEMQLTVRNSAQLKFGGQIVLPLNQPVTVFGHTFTLVKVDTVDKGTSGRPYLMNEGTVVIE
jgi:hypothetical protein